MSLPKSRGPTMQSLLDVVKSVKTVDCACNQDPPEVTELKDKIRGLDRALRARAESAENKILKQNGHIKKLRVKLNALQSAHERSVKAATARKNGLILQIKAEGATDRNIEAVKKFAGIK